MELKRFSRWFVLAAVLVANSTATADVLPPPPPPPPGANPTPSAPPSSGTLDAPPPPPPGVNIESPPQNPPEKPAPIKTQPAPTQEPTTSIPIDGVPPPPPPPEGVSAPVQAPKKQPPVAPRQTREPTARERALAKYKAEEADPQKPAGWYGWKSIIGLVPMHALLIAGAASDTVELYIPGVIGGAIVTPIIHRAHDNGGRGWVTFGVNAAAMYVGFSVAEGYGASVILGIWNAVDIALLHHQNAPAPSKTAALPSSFNILPVIRPEYKGLSVVGQF